MSNYEPLLFNLLLNAIPIILIAIPFIFIRKKTIRRVYIRIFWGITIFYLVYFVLPVIFQIGSSDTLNNNEVDLTRGLGYMFSHTLSLIINYFQLPIVNFPFIFLIAPFVSILFLRIKIGKSANKSFKENLSGVTFETNKGTKAAIIDRLNKADWTDEKQLFKLLIVLLPISLYLLTTILKIAGLEIENIQGQSALGWFIEIFFIYLAGFLLGIHLLKSSNASYEGRFIGEKLENDASSSLITVGTPISILSILLFLIEYTSSFTLILYFFGYFLMAALIFVSYIAIFEPICILILIKIVDRIKRNPEIFKEEKAETSKTSEIAETAETTEITHNEENNIKELETSGRDKKQEPTSDSLNILYPIIFSAISTLIIAGIGLLADFLGSMISGESSIEDIIAEAFFSETQTLSSALRLEMIQITYNLAYIFIILIVGMVLMRALKNTKKIGSTSLIFVGVFVILAVILGLSGFLFGADVQWITGKLVTTDVFSDSYLIYTLRTAFINANFGNNVFYYLALPYQYSRYITAFLFIGITFYYLNQEFFTKTIRRENFVYEVTYSTLDLLPTTQEFINNNYLITSAEDVSIPETEREEIQELVKKCLKGIPVSELKTGDIKEDKRRYTTLKYMTKKDWIKWWSPEFRFIFERAELDALYIMYSDGRDVFTYHFSDSQDADSALVAGMFSAITSFIKETTKSSDYLRSIDHGDSKIIIEYGDYVFGAIFADMQTSEIRSKLKQFVTEFEEIHEDVLKKWNGNTTPFLNDDTLIKNIFD
ncbi:MAG: hypothetical protein GF364_21250 [Candidatus Lokiarchaeota archaeon]|nr:hypothetical protein [Candidatus Lokiarchaeota archaeon]